MLNYFLRRFFILIPTLFGITIIVFGIINLAPGSPIEQKIQQMRFGDMGGQSSDVGAGTSGGSKSDVTAEVREALIKQYGFDKPWYIRYLIWIKNIFTLDFGESFKYEEDVIDVIAQRLPVSLQFGITSLLLSYLICIPFGILKAIKNGSKFDLNTTVLLTLMWSIPSFMLAILLIVLFGGGSFFDWFPMGGLHSEFYDELPFFEQVVDRVHHFILPLVCYMIGSFTTLTLLMKNSMLEEIKRDYVRTAKAKGLSDKVVYLKHALRNALIPIVTGLGGILMVFFAGSLLLEKIFELDGIGKLGFDAVQDRDYNVIMCLVFVQSLLFLIGNIISDIAYIFVDPRIDFR
jgi:microcin C transport system permease protein